MRPHEDSSVNPLCLCVSVVRLFHRGDAEDAEAVSSGCCLSHPSRNHPFHSVSAAIAPVPLFRAFRQSSTPSGRGKFTRAVTTNPAQLPALQGKAPTTRAAHTHRLEAEHPTHRHDNDDVHHIPECSSPVPSFNAERTNQRPGLEAGCSRLRATLPARTSANVPRRTTRVPPPIARIAKAAEWTESRAWDS